MLIRFLCLFRQNFSNILDLIFYQSDASFLGIKSHHFFLLFIVTKLLLYNISISLVKNTLYSALIWLFGSKTSIKMFLKFQLNFFERFVSK